MWLLAQLRVLLVLYRRRSRQALVYSVLVFVLGRRVDMEQSVCLEKPLFGLSWIAVLGVLAQTMAQDRTFGMSVSRC